MRRTITVAGSLAQRPGRGGHAWVFLQWLLGLRALGYDVLFVDRLDRAMLGGGDPLPGARYLREVMDAFDVDWALLSDDDCLGLPRAEVLARAQRSEMLLNVMGFLEDEELLAAAPLRVFLDIDPGFGQMWRELELADPFAGHDRHVTIGERIGHKGCTVPTCGLDWITTKPPVALDHWPLCAGAGTRFTSVQSWRGPFGPIHYQGRTYGLRVHEFRRFLELPRRTHASFEVALDIDAADAADVARLGEHGWTRVDPLAVAGDPWGYRDYISGSAAELMIAKNLYVETRGGWFSDRSACYLASGRPVLAQDTGLAGLLPTDVGVVAFGTLDEAVAGAQAILAEPERHRRAAREIAVEHFAADRVLPPLLTALGVA
jgi:hypothetical protein